MPLVQKGYPHRKWSPHNPHHKHVPIFPVFPFVVAISCQVTPCVGDLFALRALSPPPCSLCSLHSPHSPHSLCSLHRFPPAFTVLHFMGSIPYMGDLFVLMTLSPPPSGYIHWVGFNHLHESWCEFYCFSFHGNFTVSYE